MAKGFLFFCLLIFLAACEESNNCPLEQVSNSKIKMTQNQSGLNGASCPVQTPVPGPDPLPDNSIDAPVEAQLFDAKVNFTNFEYEQEEKVYRAIEIIKSVVKSNEFRRRVIEFTYNGKRQFVDNKGLSNMTIYQKLFDGAEDLVPEIDHEMNLDLELYYSWRNTVGYTYPDGLRIWMNTKFFNVYTSAEVAGNIFHEWTHKLGFEHAVSYTVDRDASVPYALGYLMEELGKKYE